jgi:hypothetical protein
MEKLNPELWPFFLLFWLLIASLIAVLNERFDHEQLADDHEGEEEQPTDCVPDEVIRMRNDEL